MLLILSQRFAAQDKKDDLMAGVKSTALLFGKNTKLILGGFAASQVALLGLTGNGQRDRR
jgi:4-hydroxybenzoate polyprenyltransferase